MTHWGKILQQRDLFSTLEYSFWESPPSATADNGKIAIRETRCSTLLHEMAFGSRTEYTVNQYRGCSHGCVYCYAPSLIRDERSWGGYVDAKVNAASILDRELVRAKKQVVFVSSASDPYQPVEGRFKITRRVLEVLSKHRFPVLLLTRSPLVLRDLDILQSFEWVTVGFSISTVSSRFYEPGVPSLEKRLETLCKLRDAGVRTWVSMAPIVPQLILTDLDFLFTKLKEAQVSAVTLGLLRFVGYEKSRDMFEERSGNLTGRVMRDGTEIYEKIRTQAHSYGLDTTGACLSWEDNSSEQSSLDHFTA